MYQIAVIGAGICSTEESEAAETIGGLIAEYGAILVCGGMGGVMEAACRGAVSKGGITVGVIPGVRGENPFTTITLRSGMGHARNVIVVQSADAVIAVGGSTGTLSEIAIALKTGKPVYGYKSWEIPGVVLCESPGDAASAAFRACESSTGTR